MTAHMSFGHMSWKHMFSLLCSGHHMPLRMHATPCYCWSNLCSSPPHLCAATNAALQVNNFGGTHAKVSAIMQDSFSDNGEGEWAVRGCGVACWDERHLHLLRSSSCFSACFTSLRTGSSPHLDKHLEHMSTRTESIGAGSVLPNSMPSCVTCHAHTSVTQQVTCTRLVTRAHLRIASRVCECHSDTHENDTPSFLYITPSFLKNFSGALCDTHWGHMLQMVLMHATNSVTRGGGPWRLHPHAEGILPPRRKQCHVPHQMHPHCS